MPLELSATKISSLSPSTQDILTTLGNAESLFWAELTRVARRGNASRMRDATISLAMIRALQSSLGKAGKAGPVLSTALLGAHLYFQPRKNLSDNPLRRIRRHHIAKRAS